MDKSQIEKATLRQDKPLSQTTKPNNNIEQARAHLLGVCLLDATYIHRLPVCVQLSCLGKFTITMIAHGMGLNAIANNLETYGLDNASEILAIAIKSIPDNANLASLFYQALTVVCSHD